MENGVLIIEYDSPCIRNIRPINIWVSMDEIRRLIVCGSRTLVSEDELSAESLEAIMEGSGTIDLLVNTTRMVSRTDGSGSLRLRGEASDYTATIQGSGSINAFDHATRTTIVTVSGSGTAEVFVTEQLDVTIDGSGNVRYRGDPTNVNQEISGSGTVSKAQAVCVSGQMQSSPFFRNFVFFP